MSRGQLHSVVLLTAVLLYTGACAKAQLPAGWPVPGLTLPPGSVVCQAVSAERDWGVEFKCRAGNQAVKGHVEGCLRQLGYLQLEKVPVNHRLFTYLSPDGMTEVTLMFIENLPDTRYKDMRVPDYSLDITSYYKPSPELRHAAKL